MVDVSTSTDLNATYVKMKKLKIAQNTRIMSPKEFKKFMEKKTMYHRQCGWLEKWTAKLFRKDGNIEYIPYSNVILRKSVKLAFYSPTYPDRCKSSRDINGRGIWETTYWTSKYNDKNKKIYVTTRRNKK